MGSIATITAIVNFLDDATQDGLPTGEPLIYEPEDCQINPLRDGDDHSDLWAIGPVTMLEVLGDGKDEIVDIEGGCLLLTILAGRDMRYVIIDRDGFVVAKGHS